MAGKERCPSLDPYLLVIDDVRVNDPEPTKKLRDVDATCCGIESRTRCDQAHQDPNLWFTEPCTRGQGEQDTQERKKKHRELEKEKFKTGMTKPATKQYCPTGEEKASYNEKRLKSLSSSASFFFFF